MTTTTDDVLSDIDGILADWAGSDDAARSEMNSVQLPDLDGEDMAIVAAMAAQTGLDGYACAFLYADARAYEGSPYREMVLRAVRKAYEDAGICPDCGAPRELHGGGPGIAIVQVGGPGSGTVVSRMYFTDADLQPPPAGRRPARIASPQVRKRRMRHAVHVALPAALAASFTPGETRPVRWGSAKRSSSCPRCHPGGNPPPLPVNGAEYARRRRHRRG